MEQVRDHLRLRRRGGLAVVILDRQDALNALNHAMVRTLSGWLRRWREDPEVGAVVVRPAPGRAFCAGGDVREIMERRRRLGVDAAWSFFHDEYRLNWRIKRFPKPYLAVMDGITMGGGVGISIHGSHRIVTERTLFAMPETGIGFFPDVGGTYFLPRLPGASGMYLGLTGARIRAADCLHLGIATHRIRAERWPEIEERLAAVPAGELAEAVEEVLLAYAEPPEPSEIARLRPAIDRCFARDRLEEVWAALEADADGFGSAQLEVLAQKSPLALKITFRQLRLGRSLEFEQAMRLEYRLVRGFLEEEEFAEGVRAIVVERDRKPRWRYATVACVPEEAVDRFFTAHAEVQLPLDWDP